MMYTEKVIQSASSPMFIKTQDSSTRKNVYVNINDIGNIEQIHNDCWKAEALHAGNKAGQKAVYYFDDNNASKIINYTA